MKKFIKNTVFAFVIIYTVLNLILYATNIILRNSLLYKEIVPLMIEERDIQKSVEMEESIKETIEARKEIYGEDAPVTALFVFENYFTGMGHVLYGQSTILIATVVLSIVIGVIIHLKEESKIKEVLYFIVIGMIFILICMGYTYIMGEFRDINVFEAFVETINIYGPWYIIGYMLVYIFRIYKDKKKVKELNKEIEKKNK